MSGQYVVIDFEEFKQFLEDRDFVVLAKHPGVKETVFVKIFIDKDVMIKVFTSFQGGKQKKYGTDAIRCQLDSRWKTKYPPMDLSATKRVKGWQATLDYKISLLERFITTKQPCSICGSNMLPIHGQFTDKVLWICEKRYSSEKCHGTVKIDSSLQKELSDNWPKHHS